MTTALDNHAEHNFCQSPRYHRHISIGLILYERVFWKNYLKLVMKTADTQSPLHRAQMKTKGKIHHKGQSTGSVIFLNFFFFKPN